MSGDQTQTWVAHVTCEDDDWLTEVRELGTDGANTFGDSVAEADRMTRDLIVGHLIVGVSDEDVTDEEFRVRMSRLCVEYDLSALSETEKATWLRELDEREQGH